MKASAMLDRDPQWAVILAFDVKVEREAQEMADSLGVTIFTADIIYHLFDRFIKHRLVRDAEDNYLCFFVALTPNFVNNSDER